MSNPKEPFITHRCQITRSQLLAQTKALLKKYNLHASKFRSQHFMIDPQLIDWHLQFSELTKADLVVEVGAGVGTLTQILAEHAQKVIAIESDPAFINVLEQELSSFDNIDFIRSDVLTLPLDLFKGKKIISNPPYKISSPLTFRLIQSEFIISVMSYQYEFAKRMIAKPGSKEYGRLTVGLNYYAKVEYLKSIPRNFFYPIPKVDSALIRLTPQSPPFPLDNPAEFFDFVRHLFSFRNKTVLRAIRLYLKHTSSPIRPPLDLSVIPYKQDRVFQLSLNDFYTLYQLIKDFQHE
ncbi:MAG: 16S rRNA (adenine(1518)-N(6)/adenine(1519)-N(6))-dimethyltransferase RsmA [Candidatus Helarchaeota archaeon]